VETLARIISFVDNIIESYLFETFRPHCKYIKTCWKYKRRDRKHRI